jgi:hypothetical protein
MDIETSNPLFLLSILGFVICGFGLYTGGGVNQIRSGNPSRLQSACLIGIGVSGGSLGLFMAGKSTLGAFIFFASSIVLVGVGALSVVRSNRNEPSLGFGPLTFPTILWSTVGFGIGLWLVDTMWSILWRQGQITAENIFIYRSLLYALMGGCGGATLGFARKSWGHIVPFVLAGTIGCGLGYFIISAVVSPFLVTVMLDLVDDHDISFAIYESAQFMLTGAFTGALLGSAQRNWRMSARLAIVGAIGFGLYALIHSTWIFIFLTIEMKVILPLVAIHVLRSAIGGALIGICFGLTMNANRNTL